MVGGEGYTAPERVSPRGADNATNPVLVCLPCILLVNRQDGAPYQKSSSLACAQDIENRASGHSQIGATSKLQTCSEHKVL